MFYLYFLLLFFIFYSLFPLSMYQIKTSIIGIKDFLSLSRIDIIECNKAYKYLQEYSNNNSSELDTKNVEKLYKVLNIFLSIVDIEKMYIPPHLNDKLGLFENQEMIENKITNNLKANENSTLLDIGCGRGRIAHYVHQLTGAKIFGYNIDENQINNAIDYTKSQNLSNKLKFTIADHHETLPYKDNLFDGAYSYQALWPFLKKDELNHAASELFRVLKPGGIYSCSEYVITEDFDFKNKKHKDLHRLFLPTLAATQSNYPSNIVKELKNVGFELIVSKPSDAPTWTLTEQKTNVIIFFKYIAKMCT